MLVHFPYFKIIFTLHFFCFRVKTSQLEKLKSQLIQKLDSADKESKLLKDYKAEMEALLHEKMAHVEELRLIHADINLVSQPESLSFFLWNLHFCNFNPFTRENFAEKLVLKVVDRFSGHCHAIK